MSKINKKRTCDFCTKVLKTQEYQIIPTRMSYCQGCPQQSSDKPVKLRMDEPIVDDATQQIFKGLFEAFVSEVERGASIFGYDSFKNLYGRVNFYYKYLTQDEYDKLFGIIVDYEEQWGKYIDMVLNQSYYIEIASSGKGPQELKTPRDWAAAIRNLIRILADANTPIEGFLRDYISNEKLQVKKTNCKKQSAKTCQRPCQVDGKKCALKLPGI